MIIHHTMRPHDCAWELRASTWTPTFFSMSCLVSEPCGSYLRDRKTRPLQPSLHSPPKASGPMMWHCSVAWSHAFLACRRWSCHMLPPMQHKTLVLDMAIFSGFKEYLSACEFAGVQADIYWLACHFLAVGAQQRGQLQLTHSSCRGISMASKLSAPSFPRIEHPVVYPRRSCILLLARPHPSRSSSTSCCSPLQYSLMLASSASPSSCWISSSLVSCRTRTFRLCCSASCTYTKSVLRQVGSLLPGQGSVFPASVPAHFSHVQMMRVLHSPCVWSAEPKGLPKLKAAPFWVSIWSCFLRSSCNACQWFRPPRFETFRLTKPIYSLH